MATSSHNLGELTYREGHLYHFYFINFLMFKLVISTLYHFWNVERLKLQKLR